MTEHAASRTERVDFRATSDPDLHESADRGETHPAPRSPGRHCCRGSLAPGRLADKRAEHRVLPDATGAADEERARPACRARQERAAATDEQLAASWPVGHLPSVADGAPGTALLAEARAPAAGHARGPGPHRRDVSARAAVGDRRT